MINTALKEAVHRLLPQVQMPAQYIGGELNSVVKDHRQVRGKLCLAFPDTYALGMSHHGLQVLYTIMNNDPQWACERAFTPWLDFEALLRRHGLPLYSLETFTPLSDFDLVGFSLQYEVCYTNILTMLDLGGIPLHSKDRTLDHPLVIAGGPGAQNPEVLAPFIDLFVIGDGEESLPWVMDKWMTLEGTRRARSAPDMIAEIVGSTTWAYAPMFYEPEYHADGTIAAMNRTRSDVPREIMACTINAGLRRHPAADPADRSVRARRRTTASPSRSCAAVPGSAASASPPSSSGRCACAPSKPSCRRPWKATATPGTTRSACSASAPAIIPTSRSW